MKCYLVDGHGIDSMKLVDRPSTPTLGELDVRIKVKACSLNYRDLMIAKGQYQSKSGSFPLFIPLSDMAGVVEEIGSKVIEFKPGDKVLNSPFRHWPAGLLRSNWARTFIGGMGVDGVLAEEIIFPADALLKVPSHLDYIEGSTFTIAALTAWAAVVTHGKTKPGEWVLLHGTGGVSIFAAQLAHSMGARTIMTSSSKEKSDYVKKHFGVTATVNYKDSDWTEQIKNITQGVGVDVVVDVVGGETLSHSIQLCTYGGRVAVIGLLSSPESTINMRDLIKHQVQVRGIFMESTEELRSLMKAVEAIKLKPAVNKIFPFTQAKEAYHYLEAQKHIGKVVVTL